MCRCPIYSRKVLKSELTNTRLVSNRPYWTKVSCANLDGCVIKYTDLTRCRLLDCRVYNCKIVDSEIENTKLYNCDIITSTLTKNVKVLESSIIRSGGRDCKITNSKLEASVFWRSSINGGSVVDSDIQTSELTSVSFNRSRLLNNKVYASMLEMSRLHNCQLCPEVSLSGNSIITKSLDLHPLPAEIRAIIFEMAIEWEGKEVGLVTALRGDQELYTEALHVLYSKKRYIVSDYKSTFAWMTMSVVVLSKIQHLHLR